MFHRSSAAEPVEDLAAFRTAALLGTAKRGPLHTMVRFAGVEASTDTAEDTRTVTFVLSDNSVDSYNTTLDPNGWVYDRSGAGTVLLYGHNPSDPQNVIGRVHNIRVEESRLLGDATFVAADINPRAEAVYKMVRAGVINSCSVGFDPIDWTLSKSRKGGVDFTRQELLELSIVAIPSNKNALALARAAGVDVVQLAAIVGTETRAIGRVLTRDLYDVSAMADVIQWLAYLTSSVTWEASYEGDGSDIPGRLGGLLKDAGQILIDMTSEEVAELIASVTGETEDRAAGIALMRGMTARHQRSPVQRAGKALSSANEDALRQALDHLGQAKDMITAVAAANASDDPAETNTDDLAEATTETADAETRATALRLRRAKALQRRANLPISEAA
ncbi:HK97 family phage prohead protease [Lichenihabitans psoromatis]|uniref:HK97 family phage prohead protease n=1 Tax=Lichenihabitans psoromatis TaxID=2528642 RepID=UPI0013F16536|nr:HK97 family phage prohead protease [Lichenihabitans psoromatis]